MACDQFHFEQWAQENQPCPKQSESSLARTESEGEVCGKPVIAVAPCSDGFDFEIAKAGKIAEVLCIPVVEVMVWFVVTVTSITPFTLPGHVQYQLALRFQDAGDLPQRLCWLKQVF
jgi:hypothetical protein